MKLSPFHCCALLALIHFPLQSQILSGTQLEMGPTGSDQVTRPVNMPNYSAALGELNHVSFSRSMAIGIQNSVAASEALALGQDNSVVGGQTFTLGSTNTNGGSQCAIFGYANYLEGYNEFSLGSLYAVVVGSFNFSRGQSSLVVGENNWVSATSEEYDIVSSAVIGQGLISQWSESLVVGKYNDASMEMFSGLSFAIGNGTDSTHRSNAMEVYTNGDATFQGIVRVAPGGDIPMFVP